MTTTADRDTGQHLEDLEARIDELEYVVACGRATSTLDAIEARIDALWERLEGIVRGNR